MLNLEITEPKIEIVSEDKHDKGKSILGAPPKFVNKETMQKNHCSTKTLLQGISIQFFSLSSIFKLFIH